MDRNTLLAFFLIALVLLFTPKYMEVFAPPKQKTLDTEPLSNESNNFSENDSVKNTTRDLKTNNENKVTINEDSQSYVVSVKKEERTTVETDLYRAVISSFGGGIIKDFYLKKYFTQDSQDVNLLNGISSFSPVFSIKNTDGENIPLKTQWILKSSPSIGLITKETKLTYEAELFPGKYIERTLVFYPDSYSIGVQIDLSEVEDLIYRDVSFSWLDGIATTEKDIKDDLTYFKSYIYQGGEVEELKIKPGESENKTYNGSIDWAAIRSKYFVCAVIPENKQNIRYVNQTAVFDSTETYGASFVFDGYKKESLFTLYLGPLEYDRVKELEVNLDEIMDFGWAFIRPISKGVLYTLKRMHVYIPNYGVVLIVFSILVKILVFPLTKKSYQSTTAMQKIQPEINSLRDKYKNNPQKLNQATMQLYKEKGVNPLGGCFPMLLQMPLLFALFVVFRTTIELRNEPFIFWIKDLSAPDKILDLPFTIPLYGAHIAFLPILMVISTFIQQKMMTGGAQQPQQKMMQYFMTGFFFLIFNNFPSGLNLYYTLFNVLTIAQQKLLPSKPVSKP